MTISRRQILRGAGAAFTAPTVAAVGEAIGSQRAVVQGAGAAPSVLGLAAGQVGVPIAEYQKLQKRNPLRWAKLRWLLEERQARNDVRLAYRIDGLDPDIWAMHSASMVYKLQLQRKRDIREAIVQHRLQRKVWG